jgi:DNA-binding ferritin-like protein (Dps family)
MSPNIPLIQVLGAVAYGELKAHEGLVAEAERVADPVEQDRLLTFASQERRHYEGFRSRLEALGADPDRAMRPYRRPLDTYHGHPGDDPLQEAVWSYLGEGVADDLLSWLRTVVDADTASFIDSVIADEEEHEAHATDELVQLIASDPDAGRRRAAAAARKMIVHMLFSGSSSSLPMLAFLRVGRPVQLLAAITGGFARRLNAIGVRPLPLPI